MLFPSILLSSGHGNPQLGSRLREEGEKLALVYIYLSKIFLGGEGEEVFVLCWNSVFDAVWGCSKENIINQGTAF